MDMEENNILKERRDLKIIGYDKPILLYSDNGLEFFIDKNDNGEIVFSLKIDGESIMTTENREHIKIKEDVEECPENARVFIGGLGFGIVLLYLAESKKSKEAIVVEKDERVLRLFEGQISRYLKLTYPDFKFSIIKGDACIEVKNQGTYDWIYFDLTKPITKQVLDDSKKQLTEIGIITNFHDTII